MVAYLDEHITYERSMLKYAFYEMHKVPEGPLWNVMFESCCVHLRNLYEFLRNEQKAQNGFQAAEYCPGGGYRADSHSDFVKVDHFIFHMSAQRALKEKLNLGQIDLLGAHIDLEWAKWVNAIKPEYLAYVDPAPVCTPPTLSTNLSVNTACTVVDATTIGFAIAVPPPAQPTASPAIGLPSPTFTYTVVLPK